MEVMYLLETMGIPRHILPVNEIGNDDVSVFQAQLARELALRGSNGSARNSLVQDTNADIMDTSERLKAINSVAPQAMDVLMGGRGNRNHENSGNTRLRELIQSLQERYNSASKFDKTVLAQMIVRSIQDKGGRFLKKQEDRWVEVSDDQAREKVAHSFRNNRRTKKK